MLKTKKKGMSVKCVECGGNGTKRTRPRKSHRCLGLHRRLVPSVSPKKYKMVTGRSKLHLIMTDLLFEAKTLLERIVQLCVGIAEFFATHEALKSLAETRAGTMPLGEG